jgi:tetratricopeptide (TPR) repeat protein
MSPALYSYPRVGDFAGALTSFQQAEASYAKAEKFSGNHEFMMIEVKDRAETKVLSAIALFRVGKTTEAIASAEVAISELTRVEEDENINSGIRDDAEQYLQQAQSLRSRFKSSQ